MAGEQPEIPNPLPPDVDHRFEYMGGIIAITVVSCMIVWVRMYTRLVISRNAGWDDWIMFASTVSSQRLFFIITFNFLCFGGGRLARIE